MFISPAYKNVLQWLYSYMTDAIDLALDDFTEGKIVDSQTFETPNYFRQKEVKQC